MAKQDKPDGRQPAAITPDLILEPGYYRASLHMELSKFGNREKDRQLYLSEGYPEGAELEGNIQETGLALSFSEFRAIDALQMLLDRTGYKGNEPGRVVHSDAFQFDGHLPRLRITFTEYLEAYGLQRAGSSFSRAQREEAMQALDSLTEQKTVAYKRRYKKGKAYHSDVVIAKKALIDVSKGYRGLTDEQAEQVIATEGQGRRPTHLLIDFSPFWVDQIESWYVPKPRGFYDELRQVIGSRRPSTSIYLFLSLLLTVDFTPFKIGREKLAERIRLSYLLDSRHQSKLDELLQEAIAVALEMKYLLRYEVNALGMFTFYQNPERCKRIKQQPELDAEEEA